MRTRFPIATMTLAVMLAGRVTMAATPEGKAMLTKQDLFEGERGGHKIYRIPGIVVTAKGTVLAYCEARRDSLGDYGEITTFLRRSTDGGKTFGKPKQISHFGERVTRPTTKPNEEPQQTIDNPVAVPDRDGPVHFLYCQNYERAFYLRSDDDGQTFGPPLDITAAFEGFRGKVDWKVIATGPGHGIQLKSGRLVVPVWLAHGKRFQHGPSVVATIYSDDHGKTWHAGEIALPETDDITSPNESVIVELADGSVMLNGRSPSKASRRLVTVSRDGATGWSAPRFDDALWEPICAAGLTNVPGQPGVLVFSNPRNLKLDDDDQPVPAGQAKRRNLSIYVSRDDGNAWGPPRTLEEGTSAYSDLAALSDGTILCFYERDLRLTLARFNLAWAAGQDAK